MSTKTTFRLNARPCGTTSTQYSVLSTQFSVPRATYPALGAGLPTPPRPRRSAPSPRIALMLAVLPLAALACGAAWADEEKPKPPSSQTEQSADSPGQPGAKVRDLGPPLVDDPAGLKRLHRLQPLWLDGKRKQVVFQGRVCRASYPLEFFATLPGREYEAVMVVDVQPRLVHAALLATGAEPGRPARFLPKFEPPYGTEVEIEVRWKDKQGKVRSARAQDWVREIVTKKPLEHNWVFAGSGFSKEDDGKTYYQADSGDFISVSNVPIATLDLPIRSSSALDARMFEGYVERLPPPDTPVTLILKPKLQPERADKK